MVLKKSIEILFPNKLLLEWFEEGKRELPWRETSEPYSIWLSEIMLQQTRVEQGLPYYNRFTEAFPTIHELANASEDEVLKLWEGLGYYSRARNLHATAKFISQQLDGKFPDSYQSILSLKGVGPYTAAAIGSIAFCLPVAAVDGNVFRVLSRYFAIEKSIDAADVKKAITEMAQSILDESDPGNHNQAMMELGATVCTPKYPKCDECPIQDSCIGKQKKLQASLPIRTKKTKVRNRYFYYIIEEFAETIAIQKRGNGDVWQGLHEFRLIEKAKEYHASKIIDELNLDSASKLVSVSEQFKHVLSHQRIYAQFIHLKYHSKPKTKRKWVSVDELSTFAFPRLITRYLEKYNFGNVKEVSNI